MNAPLREKDLEELNRDFKALCKTMIEERNKVTLTGNPNTVASTANGKPYVIPAQPGQTVDVPPQVAKDLVQAGVATKPQHQRPRA